MKKLTAYLLSFAIVTSFVGASAETLVTYRGTFSETNEGLRQFLAENPDTSLSWSDNNYYPASAFVAALLTREFSCDLFTQGTDEADWRTLMAKGYCLDLSGSDTLTAAVRRMHPSIAAQAMYDGHLYAIPTGIIFNNYYQICKDTWLNAGYTLDEVPQSFPEFLDFLSAWCDRIEAEPEPDIAVLGGWDEEIFSSASYTAWLAELLVNEATMQKQFAGEQPAFSQPETVELLDRCAAIGARIYQLESRSCTATATLFEVGYGGTWPDRSSIVFMRLNDGQPKLMRSVVSMWAVNADSANAAKCVELLEKAATVPDGLESSDDLFIFQDAQPRISPDYETDLAYWTLKKDYTAFRLEEEGIDPDTRETLERDLQKYTGAVERTEANKWLVTPDRLRDYQSSVDLLYFPPPDVFKKSAKGFDTLQSLYNQFGHQRITAEQMLQKLDKVAEMMRLED